MIFGRARLPCHWRGRDWRLLCLLAPGGGTEEELGARLNAAAAWVNLRRDAGGALQGDAATRARATWRAQRKAIFWASERPWRDHF